MSLFEINLTFLLAFRVPVTYVHYPLSEEKNISMLPGKQIIPAFSVFIGYVYLQHMRCSFHDHQALCCDTYLTLGS